MLKHIHYITFFILLLLLGCQRERNPKLIIATAANMQFAIEEITASFTETTGIKCETIISSSGKHTAQIKEGAPFDVFLSADVRYPEELYNSGFTTAPPRIYAYGKLVLWSMDDVIDPSIEVLTTDQVKHIALANTLTAPYGKAAREVLEHFGIYETTKNKLVFGESIAQTNQFIMSEAAEIGFTAMSVVLSQKIKTEGKWVEINSSFYSPIAQGIVILKKSDKQIQAQQFLEFLFSEEGKNNLEKFGYAI